MKLRDIGIQEGRRKNRLALGFLPAVLASLCAVLSGAELKPDAVSSDQAAGLHRLSVEDAKAGGGPAVRFFRIGPTRSHRSIQEIESLLVPGDLVLVDGDTRYAGGITFSQPGTADRPITIRGEKMNGRRPLIAGGGNAVDFGRDHYVFEGFEIAEAGSRGLNHRAADITIRDCVVHACTNGIMSSDHGSGSLTVENCEVYDCGDGETAHQLYIATDEEAFPGSTFRLRFCYIHDGRGGNNVKSRAERNNLYSNWISNALYHNLDLDGADPASGVAADRAREDSDVVGNVLIAVRNGRNVRIGGDGTGQSNGRYRFLNNTFVHRSNKPESQIHARFGIESVEMHNNVFFLLSGTVFEDARAEWVGGVRRVSGAANWVHRAARGVPAEWVRTIAGTDPGCAALKADRLRPVAGSPLIGAGVRTTASPQGAPFPNPLAAAVHHPPEARQQPVGAAEVREDRDAPAIGAFAELWRTAEKSRPEER
jgi:hypothetical protein